MKKTIQSWLDAPRVNSNCTVIAEVAQSHDGSVGMAHAFIDAAAEAGADAIKFQTHIADEESSSEEPWRSNFSYQDKTRLDYWRRMEFTLEQWQQLKKHADDSSIHFLSSPFSIKAVEILNKIGVNAWKVASGEINNTPLIDALLATNKPIILSTGLSDLDEIEETVSYISKVGLPLAVLQCTSQYPSSPESIGLNVISEFREKFKCAVGLSDHSGKIFAGLAAATLSIQVLEVHLTLSRKMFGPDVVASITPDELKQLVEGVRYIETMMNHSVDKSTLDKNIEPLRKIFMKSIFSNCDISQGEKLTLTHLTTKKPGTGIPANQIKQLIGKKALKNISANTLLDSDDLE